MESVLFGIYYGGVAGTAGETSPVASILSKGMTLHYFYVEVKDIDKAVAHARKNRCLVISHPVAGGGVGVENRFSVYSC